MVNAQGARAGIYNLPLSYPPRPLDGWMVSGMMTPGYGERLQGIAAWGDDPASRDLESRISAWAPGYVVDVSANWEQDWRDAGLCDRVAASLEQRYRVLQGLLELDPPEVVFCVLEAPDRLQHVYYRYMDPKDAAYSSPEAARLRPSIVRCFERMDRIVGLLVDYAGPDGGVVVCSDHGFTAWDASVHTNALLSKWGFLKLKPRARAMQTRAARGLVPVAKRFLPARLAREAKGRTFSAVDWPRTRAFASPIPQQGVFVNLRGRERFGVVPRDDLEAVKDDIARRFEELTAPDGRKVTDRVWRAEEVFHGDAITGAPDLMPVLRRHRFELDDEIFHREPFTDYSHLPRGVHHPQGIVVVAGPGTRAAPIHGSVMDVTPTLLYLAGLKVPRGLDGQVLTAAFEPAHLERHAVGTTAAISFEGRAEPGEGSPYSNEEEAAIEESLRGLGYL
jgi:predicted AlkP superfamily phosphohydrolase/phosphomutase